MAANLAIERRDFKDALSNLITASAVYEKLRDVSDSVTAIIFSEKVETLGTMIKYCQH
jgi:hypothetical protein